MFSHNQIVGHFPIRIIDPAARLAMLWGHSDGGMPVIRGWLLLGGLGGFQSQVSPKGETGIPHTKSLKAEFRLKGASEVALVIFLALPGCSLANSHAFLPISVHFIMTSQHQSNFYRPCLFITFKTFRGVERWPWLYKSGPHGHLLSA